MLQEKELTDQIIGALIEVHRTLGSGLLEAVYRAWIAKEFALQGIPFEQGRPLPLEYKGVHVDYG
jgi:GxxExxY protein